jgi:hypothetical protein
LRSVFAVVLAGSGTALRPVAVPKAANGEAVERHSGLGLGLPSVRI